MLIYSAGPGLSLAGEPPGVSISGCERGAEAAACVKGCGKQIKGRMGNAHLIGLTPPTNMVLFFPLLSTSPPPPAAPLPVLLISLCAPLTHTLLSKQVQLPLNRL